MMKISTKISLGNLALLGFLVIVAFLGINSLKKMESSYRMVTDSRMPVALQIQDLQYQILQQSYSVQGFVLTGNQNHLNNFKKFHEISIQTEEDISKTIKEEKARKFLQQVKDLNAKYYNLGNKAIELSLAGQTEEANIQFDKATEVMGKLGQLCSNWVTANKKKVSSDVDAAIKLYKFCHSFVEHFCRDLFWAINC